jgi:RHS repeat-associated protein
MVTGHCSLSSCRARRVALLVVGVLVATGLSVAPDPAAGAGETGGSRSSSVAEGRHAGAPRFRAATPTAAPQRDIELWTPVSHTVTSGTHTRTTMYASPMFKQVGSMWRRLSGRVTRAEGAFPLRANSAVAPTWFGTRSGSLMRIQTSAGALGVGLLGGRDRRPRLVHGGAVPRIAYGDVMPGVDLTYDVSGHSIKESLVLHSAKARRSFTFLIRDRHHALGDPRVNAKGGTDFGGSIGAGFGVSLAAPVAFESRDRRGQDEAGSNGSAHQSVTRTRAGYRVRLWLDRSWLRGRTFPVVLDPTMVYSWEEETLSSAYAPIGEETCSGNPCLLSSEPYGLESDGSAHLDRENCVGGYETQLYYHADLSNIPPWIKVNSARFSVGIDTDPEEMGYPERHVGTHSELFEPGDSWYDGEWSDPPIEGFDAGPTDPDAEEPENHTLTVHAHERWDFDVTEGVRQIVKNGVGDYAGFTGSAYCLETRAAPRGSGRSDAERPHVSQKRDTYSVDEWWYDPSLTIDYEGPVLPPPVPVAQDYGCDCRWSHGWNRVAALNGRVNGVVAESMERHTDLTQPAPGVRMAFGRTYNGDDSSSQARPAGWSRNYSNGPLGSGWTHDYNASLEVNSVTGNVMFRDPTGGRVIYEPAGGGGYLGRVGATATLVAAGGGGWTVTARTGEKLTFDSAGRLTADVDRHGRGVTLGYTSSQLTTVTDEAGQVTTLTYGSSGAAAGKIVEVETDDGRTVEYGYATVDGTSHLDSVEDTTGETTGFSYDSETGKLDGITDPTSGQSARNVYAEYDEEEPIDDEEVAERFRIVSQTDANGETTHFDWKPTPGDDIPPGSGIATTTDPAGFTTRDLYYGNILIQHIDAGGNETSYTYDSNLNLAGITDAWGQVTTMTYDSAGNMLNRTGPDPTQVTESWTYSGDDQVTSHTDGRGKTTSYDYDTNGQLETVTDALDNETSYTYDTDGNLATLTTPEGRTTTYDYDAQGNQISQTSPEGHETTWTYDDAGNQTSQTTANGNEPGATPADYTTTDTYDDAGRMLTSTDPLGTVTENSYDDSGRLETSTVTDAASNILHDQTYSYDDAGHLRTTVDLARTTATNTYDNRGQLATSTDAEGHTTTYGYDHAGRTESVTSPRGNETGATPEDFTTSYSYDELGRLYATATPYGPVGGVMLGYAYDGYDENNQHTHHASAQTRETTTGYDQNGNVTSVQDGMGRVSTNSYDDAGRLTESARPDQDPTTYTYDDDGLRLTQTSPSADSTRSWTYDDDARVLTQVSPRGNAPLADPEDYSTTYTYDAEGHTTSVTDPLGHETSTTFDPLGNPLTSTNPRSKTTTWAFDAASRVTSATPPGGGDPTTYDYDTFGDLESRTDALSHETTYTYNDLHQVTSVTDPLGRTKTYDYDADSNLTTTITARGNELGADSDDWTITQTWDVSGSLISRTLGDPVDPDETAYYLHDADGLLTGYTDAHGATYQSYNGAGQLVEVTQPDFTSYGYAYNDTGDIASRTYPNGDTTAYTYNDDGLIDTQTTDSQTTSYSYNPDQQLTQIEYPATTDIVENRDYDPAGQISDITTLDTSGPTVIDGFAYTRDAGGNPTRITQTVGATATPRAFTYDDRSWLTTECPGVTTCTGATNYIAYSYDDVGNRLGMDRVGSVPDPGTTDYTYDNADQLTSTDDGTITNFTYDADGNLTSGARTWNALNQMSGSNSTGTAATTYTYDALGNRIAASTGTESIELSWDANASISMLAVTTNPDDEQSAYSYTPTGNLLQTQHPDKSYPRSFHTTDALGSITGTFKTDGTPTVEAAYDAYGNASLTSFITGAVEPQLGYTGGYIEPGTRETHLRARDYNATTGRFVSRDPAALPTSEPAVSPYLYVNNQPLLGTDPTGMCWPESLCHVVKEVVETTIKSSPGYVIADYGVHHTIGLCGDSIIAAGLAGTASVCFASVGGKPTLLVTPGGGGGTPCAGLGGSLLLSNATEPSQLGGWFGFGNISAGELAVITDTVAVGNDADGNTIWTNQFGIGAGVDVPIPFAIAGGASYTWYWSW